MSDTVSIADLGFSVYGTAQKAYTAPGLSTTDFESVVNYAAFRQVEAFESETVALSRVVEKRKKKCEELGEALAIYNAANQFKNDASSSTESISVPALKDAQKILQKYGVTCYPINEDDGEVTMTRENLEKQIQQVKSEIDIENADLEECTSAMQALVNKRDNAYSTATSLSKKLAHTVDTLIGGFSN